MPEYFSVFIVGGLLYGAAEIIWRGWTHWTMLICGGLCFTLMYLISSLEFGLLKKCFLSAVAITTVEYFTGRLVNLRLGMMVWDYSDMPFHLSGQICPQFSLLWLLLSLPGLYLCSALRRLLR